MVRFLLSHRSIHTRLSSEEHHESDYWKNSIDNRIKYLTKIISNLVEFIHQKMIRIFSNSLDVASKHLTHSKITYYSRLSFFL